MVRTVLALLALVALSLVLVACGGDDDDDEPTTGPTDEPTATIAVTGTAPPVESGEIPPSPTSEVPPDTAPFNLTSEAFEDGGRIPDVHTCSGDNSSPPLAWTAIEAAGAYVLVMTDLDARAGAGFDHWAAWNIDASATGLGTGQPNVAEGEGITQGLNEAGTVGYIGPCPPPGSGNHRYVFTLYAVAAPLDLPLESTYDDVVAAAVRISVASTSLTGTYSR